MIQQCAVIFAFLAIGEIFEALTGVTLPGSIIGMLLLTTSLKVGIIKLGQVEKVADFLVQNLGFFFVPAGIGVMCSLHLIAEQWMPIVGASVISTFVIIAVTGRVHQWMRHRMHGKTPLAGLKDGIAD